VQWPKRVPNLANTAFERSATQLAAGKVLGTRTEMLEFQRNGPIAWVIGS
jgi:hypothetical protein